MYKSDDGSWVCSSCSYGSRSITSVKEHVESKHLAPQQYLCSVCNYSCPTRKALKMHIFRNKHWNNFLALNDIIKSKMLRSEDGMFGCSDCDYSTKYSTTMQNHIESKHLSTSGFYCKYCQKFCPTRRGWISVYINFYWLRLTLKVNGYESNQGYYLTPNRNSLKSHVAKNHRF